MGDLQRRGIGGGARGRPPTGSSATRTISWSWSPAPGRTPKRCATRWQRCSPRWACACRRRRRGSCHIDEGFDFLGFRIQRHPKRGSGQALRLHLPVQEGVWPRSRRRCGRSPDRDHEPAARRPAAPAQPGAAGLDQLLPARRVQGDLRLPAPPSPGAGCSCWLRHKHPRANWKWLRRRYLPGWWPTDGEVTLFNPATVTVTRYRYRGARIPTPWTSTTRAGRAAHRHGLVESRMRGNAHVRFGGRAGETDRPKGRHRAPARPLQGRPCGRPPSSRPRAGSDTTVAAQPGSPCRIVIAHGKAGGRPAAMTATGLGRQHPWVVPAPTSSAASYPLRSMSAGRPARSPGVAGHGLVQSAEGLLDAGVEVVRTLGVVLDCSGWLGRWLGEPCAGLVGDRAGLVALGAVEAIIRVGMRGVGHGDHPGSRSGWAARPAPRSEGNFEAPARAAVPSASCRVESTCE